MKPTSGKYREVISPENNNMKTSSSQSRKNTKKSQQISSLQQEFENLKSKIIDVENKNEKLIDNIHKEFNFKKKEGGYS